MMFERQIDAFAGVSRSPNSLINKSERTYQPNLNYGFIWGLVRLEVPNAIVHTEAKKTRANGPILRLFQTLCGFSDVVDSTFSDQRKLHLGVLFRDSIVPVMLNPFETLFNQPVWPNNAASLIFELSVALAKTAGATGEPSHRHEILI